MSDPVDPRWPRLLSLAVHEFRTPITVVNGYIRMLLKERAGPLSEPQRKLLEEAEKSCGRLSALVAEMSDLSALEAGTAAAKMGSVDLHGLLADLVQTLPELPDRDVAVELQPNDAALAFQGDGTRLRTALAAIITALRREIVSSDRLVVRTRQNGASARETLIAFGAPEQIDAIDTSDPSSLPAFDQWRGGSGLALIVALRIIAQHGGTLYGPPGEGKAGALLVFADSRER